MKDTQQQLTPRQARFVEEYLVDLNATQAAIRAGYSPKGAEVTGSQLLRIPKVAELLSARQATRSEATGVSAERVLIELAVLAFSDVRHFLLDDETGRLVLARGAPDAAWRAVSSVDYKTTTRIDGSVIREAKLKLWDKAAALQMAGKHLGMFVEKHEHTGKDGAPLTPAVVVVPGTAKDMAEWQAQQKPAT